LVPGFYQMISSSFSPPSLRFGAAFVLRARRSSMSERGIRGFQLRRLVRKISSKVEGNVGQDGGQGGTDFLQFPNDLCDRDCDLLS
jgi:hypothetical protein